MDQVAQVLLSPGQRFALLIKWSARNEKGEKGRRLRRLFSAIGLRLIQDVADKNKDVMLKNSPNVPPSLFQVTQENIETFVETFDSTDFAMRERSMFDDVIDAFDTLCADIKRAEKQYVTPVGQAFDPIADALIWPGDREARRDLLLSIEDRLEKLDEAQLAAVLASLPAQAP